MSKTYFKDLSLPVQIGIVIGYLMAVLWALALIGALANVN
jgi:hypothetical protein